MGNNVFIMEITQTLNETNHLLRAVRLSKMLRESALLLCFSIVFAVENRLRRNFEDVNASMIEIFDLTHPTTWQDLSEFYGAVEKRWKICINCGIPGLGTAIHLEHATTVGSMKPAVIPTEYLITRLSIIDVSYLAQVNPGITLTWDVAVQWPALKRDPQEPTLLLFKFGWRRFSIVKRQCVCKIPGLSYELAEWISSNLSHVVGVATDAPTLESDQTREHAARTVSNLLGRSGIYIIENVNLRKRLPEQGCMAIVMPLKLLEASYVPARLTAFCPTHKSDRHVSIALKKQPIVKQDQKSRLYDVNLNEILN